MTYLLTIVTSLFPLLPGSSTVTEFSSKEACEAALAIQKKRYETVDSQSRCESLDELKEKAAAIDQIRKAEQAFKDMQQKRKP